MSNQLPKASSFLITENEQVKIHSLISPNEMFANATHIIELPTQLILVDGHFFAQYAQEFKELADSLKKPVSRFYISHDHPDHYIGFGDAFPDTDVYALKAIKEAIQETGQQVLEERQKSFGPLIASKLNAPKFEVIPGTEKIDGVTFIFEEVLNAESPNALIIKLPELDVLIAQDVIYNNTHMFLTGPTDNWKKAIQKIINTKDYDIILAGHGPATDKVKILEGIEYLDFADEVLKKSKTATEYKKALLEKYPDYAGEAFIDIYTPFFFQ